VNCEKLTPISFVVDGGYRAIFESMYSHFAIENEKRTKLKSVHRALRDNCELMFFENGNMAANTPLDGSKRVRLSDSADFTHVSDSFSK